MTAPTLTPQPTTRPSTPAAAPAVRRRWRRVIIPYAVALTLLISSSLIYLLEQADPTDRSYLSPVSTAPTGAKRLADRLAGRGIQVRRHTEMSTALVRAMAGNSTLFLPAPGLLHPFQLRMLQFLPRTSRVLVIEPSTSVLELGRLGTTVDRRRLAARAATPSCAYPPAAEAGRAGVDRTRYARQPTEEIRCYQGAVTVLRPASAELILVGAADPFRNDRIDEVGNSALATGLLAGAPEVLWVDVHRPQPMPGYVDDPALASQPPAPPSLGPGVPDPAFPIPDTRSPSAPPSQPDQNSSPSAAASPRSPVWDAFPAWMFAVAVLLALAVGLFALAQARRLGGPVAEPLPVVVRATETVHGRGRLYHRARARGPALAMLRQAARHRIAHLLDLPSGTDPETVVATVARHSGWPEPTVRVTLYGQPGYGQPGYGQPESGQAEAGRRDGSGPDPGPAEPASDQDLMTATQTINALLRAVTDRPASDLAAPPAPAEPMAPTEPASSPPAAPPAPSAPTGSAAPATAPPKKAR